jgi:hypothetical protein
MKRFSWSDLAEAIGHVAIVASLIFVGLQLMQSQDIAIASQYQDRAAAAVEYNGSQMHNARAIAEKGANIIAFAATSEASATLNDFVKDRSPESVGMWFYENRVFFTMLDNFHYQYSAGFMEEESWDAFRRELRKQLAKESIVAYYENYRLSMRASFEELCDELLGEIESADLGR